MADIKTIKRKIKSVRNIQQITQAMKMIAAVRIKKAENQARAALPYVEDFQAVIQDLIPHLEHCSHPLTAVRPVRHTGAIVVTSDRGLCGSYNLNLLRGCWNFIREQDDKLKFLVVLGLKGRNFFRFRKLEPHDTLLNWLPEHDTAQRICQQAVQNFENESIDELHVFYNKPLGSSGQSLTHDILLPLKLQSQKLQEIPFLFEPGSASIFAQVLPKFLSAQILQILLEAKVAEFSARIKAMNNATDNAETLVGDLNLQYFRARQEAITTEVLEVISGAALR